MFHWSPTGNCSGRPAPCFTMGFGTIRRMEKIATSFCSFEVLVRKYTYVDKTDMLWRLVSDSTDRMFFISRPRRFGKSLMLDTLKCIFEGRRDLFKGLKIEKKRYDWKKYPVVMLNIDEPLFSAFR